MTMFLMTFLRPPSPVDHLGEQPVRQVVDRKIGKLALVGDHPQHADAQLLDHRQMGVLEVIEILHLVDDDPAQIDSGKVHVFLQKQNVVQNRVLLPAAPR